MSNGKRYMGVDIGGTSVKLGLVDEYGIILCSEAYDVAFDRYETPILETVLKSMKLFLAEHKIMEQELEGIGVSATGGIDTVNGVVIGSAGHIQNWEGSRIKDEMEKIFHLPTAVLNDANAGGSWRNVDRSCSRPSECYCNDGWDRCWRWDHCSSKILWEQMALPESQDIL